MTLFGACVFNKGEFLSLMAAFFTQSQEMFRQSPHHMSSCRNSDFCIFLVYFGRQQDNTYTSFNCIIIAL